MLLKQEKSIAVENGRIRVSCSQGAAAFRERLKKGTCALRDGRTSGVDAMQLRRTSNNTPLWLVLRPLSGDQRPENSRIAVILHCHNDEPDVPLEALQHLFGLTRAEAAVALRLARGKTVKEVTEELGVSLSTTRTHLRSIFDKTCIDKQTKLVRTVLRGISMLSCR
jgi:DNA-binding CsgD family transcriptional regulator